MNARKWNIICLVVSLAIVAALFAILPSNLRANMPLSDADLASFWGGYKWCDGTSYSKCRQDVDCEDVICSPCNQVDDGGVQTWPTGEYCTGNSGNTTNVTACYKSETKSDSCSDSGDKYMTSCTVDVYSDSSCLTKTSDDKSVGTKDCI